MKDENLNLIEKTYRQLISEGKEIRKLFSGNPNEQGIRFPSGPLKKSYENYFNHQDYRPDPKGLLVARETIQKYYAKNGASLQKENILLTSGTSESFFYLFSLLAKPGDNILTPNPSYPLFDHIAKLAGVELRQYSLDEEKNWSIDMQDLQGKTDHRTRGIVLISPHNPTGAVLRREELLAITEWANKNEIPLICDEVFSEFYFEKGKFPRAMVESSPRLCFTLNGISKMFALPALKLGWIAVTGEESRVRPMVDHLETTADTFLSVHIPVQETLPSLFREGESFLQEYHAEVHRRRERAIGTLRRFSTIRFVEPAGGFYLMAKIQKSVGLTEEEFVIRLMKEKKVFVHPGYFYDYEKGIHFVISFLTKEEELEEGLQAVGDFISRLG
ncbi:MAG: pyridoxal phosphate-dependent aminotransferase [Deltaproteobacteria bacterium]|nr:pyridoxal phosphate-dependent aminotransferase [Deltaproteobacteria bacterium]